MDRMEEVRQLLLVEAKGRERRDRQLEQIRARDSALLQGAVAVDGLSSAPSLKVEGSALGVVGGPVAALRAWAPSPVVLAGVVSGMVGGPVAAPRGLVPSAGAGVRPGLLPAVRTGVSVSPPQVLGTGLGAPVPAVGAVPLSPCEEQQLQQLRDEAWWAAAERARLSVRAPAFVPEDDEAFLPMKEIMALIRNAGGIPAYPLLLDGAGASMTEFENSKEKLKKVLEGRYENNKPAGEQYPIGPS